MPSMKALHDVDSESRITRTGTSLIPLLTIVVIVGSAIGLIGIHSVRDAASQVDTGCCWSLGEQVEERSKEK